MLLKLFILSCTGLSTINYLKMEKNLKLKTHTTQHDWLSPDFKVSVTQELWHHTAE